MPASLCASPASAGWRAGTGVRGPAGGLALLYMAIYTDQVSTLSCHQYIHLKYAHKRILLQVCFALKMCSIVGSSVWNTVLVFTA